MGGCSSKPKTAEFEGAMEVQEDSPQDEAARNSAADFDLKGKHKKQETLESGAHQNALVEEERIDSRGMLSETDKNFIADFDEQAVSKMERQVLGDDSKNVKQSVEEETTHDLSLLEKELKDSSPESSQLSKDSKLIEVSTPELQERSMVSTIGVAAVNLQDEPFTFCNHSVEMQVQPVLPEYETPTAQELSWRYDEGASHRQDKIFSSQDDDMRWEKDAHMEPERPSVLHDSAAPKAINLELQKDPEGGDKNKNHMAVASPRKMMQVDTKALQSQDTPQEARKAMVELQSQDAVHQNGVQRLIGSLEQKNEAEKITDYELTSNGIPIPDSLTEESRKDLVGDKGFLLGEDQSAKDEAVEAENSVISSNAERFYSSSLDDGVHEERMQAKVVDAAGIICTESTVKSQGEPVLKDLWPDANDLRQESAGDVASDDSWYILENVDVEDNHSSSVVKEHIDTDIRKNDDGFSRETSRTVANCDEVLCPADQVADPMVRLAIKDSSEAQPVHGMGHVGLTFKYISDQEIPARDIDDVLEKLASEFERQESLARSAP